MFQYLNCNTEIFSHLSANTPDVVLVNEECRKVFVLEFACTFYSRALVSNSIPEGPQLCTV